MLGDRRGLRKVWHAWAVPELGSARSGALALLAAVSAMLGGRQGPPKVWRA